MSFISLLISNVAVIILAVIEKWDAATILWVYWMQSVIIGFFQFVRILSLKKFSTEKFTVNNQPVLPTVQTKKTVAVFFAFHYGFFHFIYAIFLFNIFKISQPVDGMFFFLGSSMFFLNHFFSYRHNRIIDELKIQNIGQIMFAPYVRIVPMHVIIIFGFFLGQSTLIVFLLLKTIADLFLHTVKHKTMLPLENTGSVTPLF